MQFFAWFEAHGLSRGNADFGAGAGIATDTGFAGANAENAKPAQFDALAGCQGQFQALENRIHRGLCLGARQARALDYVMDDVLLNQWGNLAGATGLNVLRPTLLMLQVSQRLGNIARGDLHNFLFGKLRCNSGRGPPESFQPEFHSRHCYFQVPFVESRSKDYANFCDFGRPGNNPVRLRRGMSIQSDRWIREQAINHRMIEPFSEKQVREGVISYGLSSYGYDLRVSDEFKIFTNVNSAIIDPKAFDERSFVSVQAESVIVPPNSFALARSIEYFRIPRDVLTICVGKSTYARCGIIVNVTPFEPEWEGFVTLEISNTTPLPAKVYANEGLCQILFFRSNEPCEISYADRKGKYQNQQGIVLPKL